MVGETEKHGVFSHQELKCREHSGLKKSYMIAKFGMVALAVEIGMMRIYYAVSHVTRAIQSSIDRASQCSRKQ